MNKMANKNLQLKNKYIQNSEIEKTKKDKSVSNNKNITKVTIDTYDKNYTNHTVHSDHTDNSDYSDDKYKDKDPVDLIDDTDDSTEVEINNNNNDSDGTSDDDTEDTDDSDDTSDDVNKNNDSDDTFDDENKNNDSDDTSDDDNKNNDSDDTHENENKNNDSDDTSEDDFKNNDSDDKSDDEIKHNDEESDNKNKDTDDISEVEKDIMSDNVSKDISKEDKSKEDKSNEDKSNEDKSKEDKSKEDKKKEDITIEELFDNIKSDDRTPNEKRYIDKNIYHDVIFFPKANIYPSFNNNSELLTLPYTGISKMSKVNIDWFLNLLKDQQIEYAIKYLQINALKQLLIPGEYNVFLHLINCKYPYEHNIEAYNEIILILLERCTNPVKQINELIQQKVNIQETYKHIFELLFSLMPCNENLQCIICTLTQPEDYLIKICNCTNLIHVICFEKWIEKSKLKKCTICNSIYKINDKCYGQYGISSKPTIDERIYYPTNDIYYMPLMRSLPLKKFKGIARLTMAINYLQVERVKELLQEKEILDTLPEYYHNEAYKQTPIITLCTGNIGTNYMISMGNNGQKYYEILVVLIGTKKINLEHKDEFNKSARYYAISQNIEWVLDQAILEASLIYN